MPIATLNEVVIDVPADRAVELAQFYGSLLGYAGAEDAATNPSNPLLQNPDGADIGLQRVEGFVGPTWPTQERGQQMHLMLDCASFSDTMAMIERLGGSRAAIQSTPDFPIMLDPVGHPICFTEVDDMAADHPRVRGIAIDCDDHRALASFYMGVFGGDIDGTDDHEFTTLRLPNGLLLSCEQVDDYRPPTWPSQERGQQVHVDTAVTSVADAVTQIEKLGGRMLFDGQAEWHFAVMSDPAGHPFCIGESD